MDSNAAIFRQIVDDAAHGVVITAPDGTVRYLNAVARTELRGDDRSIAPHAPPHEFTPRYHDLCAQHPERVHRVRHDDGTVVVTIDADASLRDAALNRQLRYVVDRAPAAIVVHDAHLEIIYRNHRQREQGPAGSNLIDLAGQLHPDDAVRTWQTIQDEIAHDRPWTVRCRGFDDGNDLRWYDIEGHWNAGANLGVILTRDVTDTVDQRAELAQYKALFDTLTDFVAIVDDDGKIVRWNRVAAIYGAGESHEYIAAMFDDASRRIVIEEALPEARLHGYWTGELTLMPEASLAIPVSLALARCEHEDGTEFIAALARDITDLAQAQLRLEEQATHDQLTGLPNRRLFTDRLRNALARSTRVVDRDVAVLFVDLDGFKSVNDVHGHDRGDLVLIEVGRRLCAAVREGDTVARLGGDEFVVLLDPVADANDAPIVAQRIVDAIAAPVRIADAIMPVGASVGWASASQTENDAVLIMKAADLAVYDAKRRGKGCVVGYEPDRHGSAAA